MSAPVSQYRKTRDDRYFYRGNFTDGGISRLRLLGRERAKPDVVLSELDENENTSVTNMIEYLATDVISKFLPWRWNDEPPAIVPEHCPPLRILNSVDEQGTPNVVPGVLQLLATVGRLVGRHPADQAGRAGVEVAPLYRGGSLAR